MAELSESRLSAVEHQRGLGHREQRQAAEQHDALAGEQDAGRTERAGQGGDHHGATLPSARDAPAARAQGAGSLTPPGNSSGG